MKPYKPDLDQCEDMLKLIKDMRRDSKHEDAAVITLSLDETEAFVKMSRKGLRAERAHKDWYYLPYPLKRRPVN